MAEGSEVAVLRIASADRPAQVRSVAAAELDGEVVLLDGSGRIHLLNPTAGLLWACFDGQVTVAQIAADAANMFGMPVDAMLADVCAFAGEMAALGLVSIPPSPATGGSFS